MTSRCSAWMLLTAGVLLSTGAVRATSYFIDPPEQKSHIILEGIPEDRDGRLQEALRQAQKGERLEKLLQDLQDPKRLEKLRDKVPQDLLKKLQNGDVSGDLSRWQSLVDVVKDSKDLQHKLGLGTDEVNLLKEFVEKHTKKSGTLPSTPQPGSSTSSGPNNPSSPPTPPPAPQTSQSAFEQTQKSAMEWLREQAISGARDMLDQLEDGEGGSSASSLRETIRRLKNMDFSDTPSRFSMANRIGDLSRIAPRLNELLANRSGFGELTALVRNVHLPERPRLGGSLPTVSGRSLSGFAATLLWLMIPIVLALLAWTYRAGVRRLAAVTDRPWRLGPWPVRPDAVSTREELIRAFEYLAFLYLGPDARTCNHREVAEILADEPDAAPERRRDAARNLAQRYEEARYAATEPSLSADEWRNVRRDLCLLAGVPGA